MTNTTTTTTKAPTAKAKARAEAAAVMVDAIDGVDKAHGAVTIAALVNEALYRPMIGGADGVVPRTGDMAPKGYYMAAGLSEAMYDRAKGYLSDARNVIGHAVAMGTFDHKAVTTLAKAEAMGPSALLAVAKAVGVAPDDRGNVSLTKVSAAVRAKAKGQGAPRAKAGAATKADGAEGTKADGPRDLIAEAKALGAAVAASKVALPDAMLALLHGAGVHDRAAAVAMMSAAWRDMP